MRTLHPASYTGLDLNPAGIALCREMHNLLGLDFVQGDAEDLPFPDQSFDAVINIEASHLYGRFPRFLAEVLRVLRPGGHFLYADLRPGGLVSAWEAALSDARMRLVSCADISAEVVRSARDSQWTQDLISSHLPAFLHGLALKVADVHQLAMLHAVQSGQFHYRMYCFAKD